MSGVEVASLILGAFPLIISGIENYQKGLTPIRVFVRYRSELIALHALIVSEYSKFQNSLDLLLQPLIPPSELHHLITKPEKINWTAPHLKASLRRRLGPSEEAFYGALQVIEGSVKELKAALKSKDCLDRLHYCFVGSSKRENTKARLQQGNNDLQSFVIHAKRLGDARERRSLDVLEAGIKRKELCELHASLSQDPWRCSCPQHSVHLDVCSLTAGGPLGKDKNASAEVIIGLTRTHRSRVSSSVPTLAVALTHNTHGMDDLDETSISLSNSVLSSAPSVISSGALTSSSAALRTTNHTFQLGKSRNRLVKKGVAFALPPQQSSLATPSASPKGGRPSPKITSVCTVIDRQVAMRDHVGYLETKNKARMHVYALPKQHHRRVSSESPALSLCRALGASTPPEPGQTRRLRPPTLLKTKVRLKLASAMALSYPQLQSTPWSHSGLDKSDIIFMCWNRPDATIDLTAPHISQNFTPRSAPRASSTSTAVSDSSSAMSMALAFINQSRGEGLFALGKLLVELAFNSPLENLYEDEDKDHGKVFEFTGYLAAKRLLPEIYEEHGYLYGEAVRRCIEGVDIREKVVENPEFRRVFLRDIFQPLQDTSTFFNGNPG